MGGFRQLGEDLRRQKEEEPERQRVEIEITNVQKRESAVEGEEEEAGEEQNGKAVALNEEGLFDVNTRTKGK